MDQVITHNKTYQERYLEYTQVFSGYDILSATSIKNEWSFYIELAVDTNGWQAIWKIPRLRCEALKIAFPTVVLVYVESVEFTELTATVKILAVQDDIHLPNKHEVPLIQLWPTTVQDKTVGLNLESTANQLDMLRFFYMNLFMPWDLEEEATTNWFTKHLEPRLRLYYDMRNGVIPVSTSEHLKSLLTEARHLEVHREQISAQIDDDSVDVGVDMQDNVAVKRLLEIHVRMMQIRNEIELLEDPVLRNTLLKTQQQRQPKKQDSTPENWVIFNRGNIKEFIEFLKKVEDDIGIESVKFVSHLTSALEEVTPNDTILLSPTTHLFGAIGRLENGGIMKGLYSKDDTIITSLKEDVMLDFSGDVVLVNLTINVDSAQCGILVRSGTVTMKNCKIIGDGISSTHQGIIVLAGGKLNVVESDVTGFYTAIVGNSGSSISIKNSKVFNVHVGVKIYDNCIMRAEGTVFHHCKEYGVCVESDNADSNIYKCGNFEVLEVIPDVTTENVTGESNGKADVTIYQKRKLQPVQDLFSNPELDPTVTHISQNLLVNCEDDDDVNMSLGSSHELDNTVIEVNGFGNNSI